MEHLGPYLSVLLAIVVLLALVWPSIWSRYEGWRERREADDLGHVLDGAEVRIASVEPAEPVADAEDPLPRAFYRIDMTITPRPVEHRGSLLWEPLLLDVVDPDESVDSVLDFGADLCKLYAIEVWEMGRFISENEIDDRDAAFEVEGAGRVRLLVGVHESVRRFALCYYTTEFGDIRLAHQG